MLQFTFINCLVKRAGIIIGRDHNKSQNTTEKGGNLLNNPHNIREYKRPTIDRRTLSYHCCHKLMICKLNKKNQIVNSLNTKS